jgi:hypothetical protein
MKGERVARSAVCASSPLAVALPRNGASWRAGVGWVRPLAFLSILRGGLILAQTYRPVKFW